MQDDFYMEGYFTINVIPIGENIRLMEESEEGELKALVDEARGCLE